MRPSLRWTSRLAVAIAMGLILTGSWPAAMIAPAAARPVEAPIGSEPDDADALSALPSPGTVVMASADSLEGTTRDSAGIGVEAIGPPRLSSAGPAVTILSPANGAVLSGAVVVAANVSDAGSGFTPPPEVALLNASPFTNMSWNGTDWVYTLQTVLFEDGRYRLVVRAYDPGGNVSAAGIDVTIANSAPVATIVSPAAGDLLSGTVRVWARTASGLEASLVELRVDSGPWTPMAYDAGSNRYYGDWDTMAVADLGHTLSVRASAGSAVGPASSVSVTVDNAAPVVGIVAPAAGGWLTGVGMVRVSATDRSPLDSVSIRIDGQGWVPAQYDGLTDTWIVPVDTTRLIDFDHDVVARAIDALGNTATTASTTFSVDNTPPTISIAAPLAFQILSGSAAVSAAASDAASGISAVYAQLGPRAPVALSLAGGAWTASLNTVGLSDGAHTLTVWAEDAVGLTARASIPVAVDNGAPSIAFLSPAEGAVVGGIVDVRVGVADAVGIVDVTLVAGTATISVTASMALAGANVYAYALDTAVFSGTVVLTATARDAAGLARQASRSVRVDNEGPAIQIFAPSGDVGLIQLTASVTDADAGVARVVFVVDGVPYEGIATGQGEYWVQVATTRADNGEHLFEVVATDGLGNVARQYAVLEVNNPSDLFQDLGAISPFLILLVAIAGLVLYASTRGRAGGKRSPPPGPPEPPETEDPSAGEG